jgi:methylglutaconyl-CoA hydratase
MILDGNIRGGTPVSDAVLTAGTVTSTVAEGIARIRFGHPKSNALPAALLTRLAEAIAHAGEDPAARVILLASEGGGAFCAGASFDEFRAIADAEAGKKFFSGFARVILAMLHAPKFVLARVHGRAAGGGVGLIAASDYALATAAADIKLSELAVGIGPFVVGPVIEHRIGAGALSALAVDTGWRSAAWAERHGLFAEVLESTVALDERVEAQLRKLAGFNPEAMRQLKATFWAGSEDWPALLAARAEISGTLVLSEYTRRAIGSSAGGQAGRRAGGQAR